MTKSVFDLTFEELSAIGQRATADAVREAQLAGVHIATLDGLVAANVTPLKPKSKPRAAGAPARRATASRARKGV